MGARPWRTGGARRVRTPRPGSVGPGACGRAHDLDRCVAEGHRKRAQPHGLAVAKTRRLAPHSSRLPPDGYPDRAVRVREGGQDGHRTRGPWRSIDLTPAVEKRVDAHSGERAGPGADGGESRDGAPVTARPIA